VVKSGGDAQSWYFNNALPTPYSVTVRDANNCPVPGASVTWSSTTGGGTFSPNPSTTAASGVAITTHTLNTATTYVVNATVSGLAAVTFSASASAPPTSGAVNIANIAFNPASVVVQVNGAVTWTWGDGTTSHNVTYTAAPGTPPASSVTMATGTFSTTFTQVGTYRYVCTLHGSMNNGVVTVVN
jgi:plastocyanin